MPKTLFDYVEHLKGDERSHRCESLATYLIAAKNLEIQKH